VCVRNLGDLSHVRDNFHPPIKPCTADLMSQSKHTRPDCWRPCRIVLVVGLVLCRSIVHCPVACGNGIDGSGEKPRISDGCTTLIGSITDCRWSIVSQVGRKCPRSYADYFNSHWVSEFAPRSAQRLLSYFSGKSPPQTPDGRLTEIVQDGLQPYLGSRSLPWTPSS